MILVRIELPGLPVSLDQAYSTFKDKKTGKLRRCLSPAASAYKERTAYQLNAYRRQLLLVQKNKPYLLHLRLHMDLFTKPTAEIRYKKLDASNYIKLLEDAIAEHTGVDDRHNLVLVLQKCHTTKKPYTEITIHELTKDLDVDINVAQYLGTPEQDRNLPNSSKGRATRTSENVAGTTSGGNRRASPRRKQPT